MSPSTTPRRSPKRATSKRSPLQERTPSQKNEQATRLHKDSRQDLSDAEFFATTPFPTKPQHVLRPSTIRKQKSRHNLENELPSLFAQARAASGSQSSSSLPGRENEQRVRRAPNLQLKQSVTALRDMYEAQAERSRPSTAAPSPLLRPSTAGSRLRSASSSEGMSGRSAWELLGLPKASIDDFATLPTLSEDVVHQVNFESSFAQRMQNQNLTSTPHFDIYSPTAPEVLPPFDDTILSSDLPADHSSSGLQQPGETSPNFVQLGFDTSMLTDPTFASLADSELVSSPNIVKLGTTSPRRSSSPAPSTASTGSRKRKRSDIEAATHAGHTPIFPRQSRRRRRSSPLSEDAAAVAAVAPSECSVPSSEAHVLPSSPPEVDSIRSHSISASSPIIRLHPGPMSSDRSSIVSAHANLQGVISSSPGPIIQYPIVKAPDVNQFENLNLQKQRRQQGLSVPQADRLSPVPSEAEAQVQALSGSRLDLSRPTSRMSAFSEDTDDNFDSPSVTPAQAYIMQHDLNNSQVQIIDDADRHEAVDELSALPRSNGGFLPLSAIPTRASSFLSNSVSNGSQSRLNSMRASIDTRFESMRSYRPTSAGSQMSAFAVPTWARRYYSGVYRNSFQYLYQSTNNIPVTYLQPPTRPHSVQMTRASSSRSPSTHLSLRSVRTSIKNFIPSLFVPTNRPRLSVRDSHLAPGIGPLVSNPVRIRTQSLQYPPTAYQPESFNRMQSTIRHVSMPLSAADPRAHWNGMIESTSYSTITDQSQGDYGYAMTPARSSGSSTVPPVVPRRSPKRFLRQVSPHLHRDRHLDTGSSMSRGFGYPYNTQVNSPTIDVFGPGSTRPGWFRIDLRDIQVVCFISGFLLPLSWFLGAVLPLPVRPASYHDIEKAEIEAQNGDISRFTSRPSMSDWNEMDVVARLRLERHIRGLEEMRWQNARWWKRMNRWMSCVGLVVIIVVIVLAVIGTKGHWANS